MKPGKAKKGKTPLGWYSTYTSNLLKKLRIIEARLMLCEKRWLWEVSLGLPYGAVCLETGTGNGGSAYIITEANSGVRVFTTDPLSGGRKRSSFLRRRFQTRPGSVEFMPYRSDDERVLERIREKLNSKEPQIDFIFLDGEHTQEAVTGEIDRYEPWLKPGGIIAGHDYHRVFGCRKRFNAAVRNALEKRSLPLFVFDRIWYSVKPL